METVDDVKPSHKAWLFPMRKLTEFSAELLLEPGFCRCVGPWLSLRLSSGVRLFFLLPQSRFSKKDLQRILQLCATTTII